MSQQHHWITGWWQPRRERPLSFVEDDKLRPGEDVTSSKRRHKNSMKCAIAKFLNQDGRPERYWKLKRMMENSANHPHPTRERTHRHRSIPEIAVLCHLPRKTSQLPAEPEEWPKRWRNSEVCIFCMCHLVGPRPRLADTDAWCFPNLLYHICGFCRCLVMFYPLFHPG